MDYVRNIAFRIPELEKLSCTTPEQGRAWYCSASKENKLDLSFLSRQQVHELSDSNRVQVLSGRVKEIRAQGVFPKSLEKNLEAAKKLVEFVKKFQIHSYNFPKRTRYEGSMAKLRDVQNTAFQNPGSIKAYMAAVKALRVGNCQELALFGVTQYKNPKSSLEFASLNRGNHQVALVGRDGSGTPSNPASWKTDTVICDLWTYTYHPALFHKDYFHSYAGLLIQGASTAETVSDDPADYSTLVAPFDPSSEIQIDCVPREELLRA